MTGRRVDDDAGGLVHDQQMLVGVRDRQLGQRDRGLLRSRSRRLDRDLLPACEPEALAVRFPVHEHGARRQEPLGRGARAHLRQPSEIAVEPLPRCLVRDGDPLQLLGARGSRSERTRAARRIPTPITMKLSARLNAGQ